MVLYLLSLRWQFGSIDSSIIGFNSISWKNDKSFQNVVERDILNVFILQSFVHTQYSSDSLLSVPHPFKLSFSG